MLETHLEPQQTVTRWDEPPDDAIRARKRRANRYMRDALRLLDPDEPIPFFCECEHADCFASVWLTGHGFDRARAMPEQELSAHEEALPLAVGA